MSERLSWYSNTVLSHMIGLCHDLKIAWIVVFLVPVSVVHDFVRR